MAKVTNISWCDSTFNPVVGCDRISPACDNCYAASWALRAGHPELWLGERRRTTDANWRKPLQWQREHQQFFAQHGRRRRVFCASLADVFDNKWERQWRRDLFSLVYMTPDLDWLVLTKRIGNVKDMLPTDWGSGYPNVWLGATIANQAEADRDIPKLLATPARVRFLSCEPLLGPIDLTVDRLVCSPCPHCIEGHVDPETNAWECRRCEDTHKSDEWAIDWVIAGGESGGNARPSHPDWFRSLRDQCAAAGVAFHFKQWGRWAPREELSFEHDPERAGGDEFTTVFNVGNRDAGRTLNGMVHDAFPG